jgi:ABC-2 type transport system permease protein
MHRVGRVSELGRAARVYWLLQTCHFRAQLEYEADFWVGVVGAALRHGASFALLWMVYQRVPHVAGWAMWETAFVYGHMTLVAGLTELFYNGQWMLPWLVRRGEFDRVLLRPISPLVQVVAQSSSIHGFGGVILGVVAMERSVRELGLRWTAAEYSLLGVTLASGVLVLGSLYLAANCVVFFMGRDSQSLAAVMQSILQFGGYPLDMFGQWIRWLITWVVPAAFVSYFPSLILLGRTGSARRLGYCAPMVAALVVLVTSGVWRACVHRYESVGH